MKKILILLSYLSLSFSLVAKENDKILPNVKTNTANLNTRVENDLPTDPLDLLLERINNIEKLKPEDFLIDFQSKMTPPGDEFHSNTVQFGGTDIYTIAQKTALYTKLNTFNTSQSAVKLFVITGRFMLGYRATTGVKASVAANEAKIINAMANKINSIPAIEQTDKKFIKDWISIWNQKRDSLKATNPKVLILFAIEGFFVDKNESLYRLENSGTLAIVDKISGFNKSKAYSLLNYGLPVTDWMKMNQTAVVQSVQNALTGTLDGTKVNTAVDLLTTAWGQPLDLSKFAPLVKTVNGLGDGDVLNIPVTERKQYITKISKSVLYDSQTDNLTPYWIDDIVANRTGNDYLVPPIDAKKALNKLLLNTPPAQADAILDQLESEKIGSRNLVRVFLGYQSVAENDAYSDYIKATTNLVFSSSTQRTTHLKDETILFNNIEFYDNSWTFNQQNTKPIEGTKIYTCKDTDVDNNGNVTYSFKITGPSTFYTTPIANGGYATQYYDSEPVKLHPFDIISYVDNVSPSAAQGIFAVPPPPISAVDKLLGTKYVSALQMRYADDNKAERSFNNLVKTGKSGVDIALLFTGVGTIAAIRNARYLAALTDFAFATGAAAELSLQTGSITNPKIKSALETYSKISAYVGFGSIAAQVTKGAVLKVVSDLKGAIKTQGETFSGLSHIQAEEFRRIYSKIKNDYPNLLPREKEIADQLKIVDEYLASRGIKGIESIGGTDELIKKISFKTLYDRIIANSIPRKFAQYGVTEIEEASMLWYIDINGYYRNFNSALAGEIPITPFYNQMREILIDALNKIPKKNGTVFRGAGSAESEFAKTLSEKQTFNFEGRFTSSSLQEEIAIDYMEQGLGDVIWQIESKSGADLTLINSQETEVLFKPNTDYLLNKVILHPTLPNVKIYKIIEK